MRMSQLSIGVGVRVGGMEGGEKNASKGKTSSYSLIVNYLPPSITIEQLREIFSSIGPLKSSRIVQDKQTGKPRDFAFVEYRNGENDGRLACEKLDGMQIDEKIIRVTRARAHSNETHNSKLVIKGFPEDFHEIDLCNLFSPHGQIVELRLVKEKSVAFLLMSTYSEAEKILNHFHGFHINLNDILQIQYYQRPCSVSLSIPCSPSNDNCLLFVHGLVQQVGERELWQLFNEYGNVSRVNLIMDKNTGLSKGYAFVQMETPQEAMKAIEQLHHRTFHGRTLQVRWKNQITY